MNLTKYPENKRLTKSQLRNRIFIGLTTLGLSIGTLSILNAQSSTQNIARNSTGNAKMRNSHLKRDNQRLKTTFDLVNMTNDDYCEWLRIYAQEHEPPEFCIELRKNGDLQKTLKSIEAKIDKVITEQEQQKDTLTRIEGDISRNTEVLVKQQEALDKTKAILENHTELLNKTNVLLNELSDTLSESGELLKKTIAEREARKQNN